MVGLTLANQRYRLLHCHKLPFKSKFVIGHFLLLSIQFGQLWGFVLFAPKSEHFLNSLALSVVRMSLVNIERFLI